MNRETQYNLVLLDSTRHNQTKPDTTIHIKTQPDTIRHTLHKQTVPDTIKSYQMQPDTTLHIQPHPKTTRLYQTKPDTFSRPDTNSQSNNWYFIAVLLRTSQSKPIADGIEWPLLVLKSMETAVGLWRPEGTKNLPTILDTKDRLVMLMSIEEPYMNVDHNMWIYL